MIEVTVHYFAMLKEQKKVDREIRAVPAGTTVNGLYAEMFESTHNIRFAINEVFVPASTPLQNGDHVAFLPPLGGG